MKGSKPERRSTMDKGLFYYEGIEVRRQRRVKIWLRVFIVSVVAMIFLIGVVVGRSLV
jgi:hypothetical protein